MIDHIQCEDCGKCRATQAAEEWCGDCEYFSCERQEDCADAAPIASVRDLLGIAPDWTGGMGSVDWVRQQRDRS